MTYRVVILSYESDKVVRVIGTRLSERKADKIDAGANHNLNHEKFFTLIEEEK